MVTFSLEVFQSSWFEKPRYFDLSDAFGHTTIFRGGLVISNVEPLMTCKNNEDDQDEQRTSICHTLCLYFHFVILFPIRMPIEFGI